MRGKTWYIVIAAFIFALLFSILSARAADGVKISADEAKNQLETATIIDSRTGADWSGSSLMIKGAIRGSLDNIEKWSAEIPKDKVIIVYCACPNEYTSARVVTKLHELGFTNARALLGGWHTWHTGGYPVQNK